MHLYIDEPWIVLEYLPHGDLKGFLTVSRICMHVHMCVCECMCVCVCVCVHMSTCMVCLQRHYYTFFSGILHVRVPLYSHTGMQTMEY